MKFVKEVNLIAHIEQLLIHELRKRNIIVNEERLHYNILYGIGCIMIDKLLLKMKISYDT